MHNHEIFIFTYCMLYYVSTHIWNHNNNKKTLSVGHQNKKQTKTLTFLYLFLLLLFIAIIFINIFYVYNIVVYSILYCTIVIVCT